MEYDVGYGFRGSRSESRLDPRLPSEIHSESRNSRNLLPSPDEITNWFFSAWPPIGRREESPDRTAS